MPAAHEMWKQFKLVEPLGKGGMGQVFLAEDTALDRKVALKFLPVALEEDKTARERFLREAKAAAALDHPYICKIYEIGEIEGKAYIAMEYIEGTTLFEKIASGPLPLARVLDLGAEIAEALEAAHKKQIVHRDIKTANIMVTPEGHVKILDFGLARMLAMEALSASKVDTYSGRLSSHDSTPGTVIYMSPEQVRGEPIDGRTDIFSLGVVLYEMATTKLPFQGATSGLIYDAILNLGPRPPSYHNPRVPPELERVILKALEKDREHRYQNAKDLMVDLKRLKRDTDSAAGRPDRPATTPRERMGMRWGALVATAGLLAALGMVLFRAGSGGSPSAAIDSLAVLPFENTRSDPEIDYLSEGIAETLINRLSPVPELRVMARSTAFRYRGLDPLVAGRELKVGAVVTGRVVQQGDSLNVQAELVDVGSGTQIWGEQYNRKLSDIVTVQNEIAQNISQALRLTLTGDEVTSNSEAYQAYWKGRFHWNRRTNEDLKKAIRFFVESFTRDPALALAHVGLADSYVLLGAQFYGAEEEFPPAVAMAKARTAAQEALALDPNLAEAYTTLAYISFLYDWNWEAAEKGFLEAIERKPHYAVAHQWYSELLMLLGRHDEAIGQGRQALELEPTSPILSRELGFRFHQARLYPEAIGEFRNTLELDPDFSLARIMLTDALWDGGRIEEALAEAERLDERRRTLFQLLAQGKTSEATAWVESFPRDEFTPTRLSELYARAGAKEKALELLEEGLEKRIPQLLTTVGQPVFDPWRSDPRFLELRRKMGLEL
ncbi:MAG TPA: protein kinase [Vicinamibacteria bacterium]|nr:protein kinase [Vicinamibacteria bacterium]